MSEGLEEALYRLVSKIYDRLDQITGILESLETRIKRLEDRTSGFWD